MAEPGQDSAPHWPAPLATGPLQATVPLPGSKSLTNRFLVLAALADGPSTIRSPLRARDTELMAGALGALGPELVTAGEDWLVRPAPLCGPATVDCGLAGTVMRFVPPVAALARGTVRIDGDPQARRRPLGPTVAALQQLGVAVTAGGDGSTLPLTVQGTGAVRGGAVTLDASTSSQFVSGLLLAGWRYDAGVTVHHVGKPVPSLPHLEMTVEVLRSAGVVVDDGEANTWRVEPGTVTGLDVTVEPDLSNAAPFLAAALVAGGTVVVPGWPRRTTQAGDLIREVLTSMGATVELTDAGLAVTGPGATVRSATGRSATGLSGIVGIDIDLHDASELTPVVAALAALAGSPSWIRGVGHIRGHETDRIAALSTEIGRLGGDVTETADGLAVRPARLHGGTVRTYHDHRMATAAAILGLAVEGVAVENVDTTAKTLPGFPRMWQDMLRQVRR